MTEPIRFFLPGPSYVPEDIRQAMTGPMIGHRSAAFKEIYGRLAARLPQVLRTAGDAMFASGSSTLLMEAAIASCVERDVLHLVNGDFSSRWLAISRSLGKSADSIDVPLGEAATPDLVRAALQRKRYEAVALVHNETSTGVISPLAEIAATVRSESDALILVDTVSSLGGAPVETDAWGLDVVLAGTQKALALPPGLVVFSFSERAAERAGKVTRRGYYTDLLRYRSKHREGGTITTPALSLVYALDVQLERLLAEGLEARWERHRSLAARTAGWAAERGFRYAPREGVRSPTVSCLRPPEGCSAPGLVKQLAARGFTVGGGYGDWKPSTFRIGHMGEVRLTDLELLLETIDQVVPACIAS
jgi:predicted phosphoserine aminotransferase